MLWRVKEGMGAGRPEGVMSWLRWRLGREADSRRE
jgi:hypothetical protein